jgi:glycosyltransferase involved in cell wall biosynthesis
MDKSTKLKKKIVLLIDCIDALHSGPSRQIYELIKHADKTRSDIFMASLECGSPGPKELLESAGCRFMAFPVKRVYGLDGFYQGLLFLYFLKRQKIDILMTYHFSSDVWGTIWGRLAGVPTIISNRRDMGFWRKHHHIWAYKMINKWVSVIVVVGKAVKESVMHEERYPFERIRVIPNGIDPQAPAIRGPYSLRKALDIADHEVIIICVANLYRVKGHAYLLKAFADLESSRAQTEKPQVRLIFAGDGDLKESLVRQARSLSLIGGKSPDKVIFLGKREDVRDILRDVDICVLPSLSEGMPNAILEYMAAGKPVIASRVGGNLELIIDGENGILFDPGNIEQLAKAMKRMITDPQERVVMGGRGKMAVKSFSIERMASRYDELFELSHLFR